MTNELIENLYTVCLSVCICSELRALIHSLPRNEFRCSLRVPNDQNGNEKQMREREREKKTGKNVWKAQFKKITNVHTNRFVSVVSSSVHSKWGCCWQHRMNKHWHTNIKCIWRSSDHELVIQCSYRFISVDLRSYLIFITEQSLWRKKKLTKKLNTHINIFLITLHKTRFIYLMSFILDWIWGDECINTQKRIEYENFFCLNTAQNRNDQLISGEHLVARCRKFTIFFKYLFRVRE